MMKQGKNRFVTIVSNDLAEWIIAEATKVEQSESAFIRQKLAQIRQHELQAQPTIEFPNP